MRLLAPLLQVWLQVQRLHGERAETTDAPGGLVICRDLREPRRIRESRRATAPATDIRELLWPMPRTVALQQQGRSVADSELSGLQPLRVDPCTMAFNLTGSSGSGLDVHMEEKYQLLFAGVAKLSAASIHGFRRGLETLLQVVEALSGESRSWTWAPGFSNSVPVDLWIEDIPRFPWRGLLLDTARHFAPIQVMESLLFSMAASKLNVLHWHVTDALGSLAMSFPLQLESLPQLALDMPAHTASWIFGEPERQFRTARTQVLPQDPNDAKNRFKARDKLALDISSKRTKKVVSAILKEMAGLFPDEFFHVGGDEVDFRCWTTMPHIAAWMRKKGLGASQALQNFFEHVFQEAAQVKRLGKRPIVWQDAFDQAEPEAQIGHASAFAATSMGFSTVQSSCWYLDWNSQYLSRRSKAEDGCCGLQQGLLKIRWTDFYNHTADEGPLASRPSDRSKPQSPMLQALFRCPTTFPGETALWSELIDFTNLNCRAWPRAAAVAERLWSEMPRSFSSEEAEVERRLTRHSSRLHRQGVALRPLTTSHEDWFEADFALTHKCRGGPLIGRAQSSAASGFVQNGEVAAIGRRVVNRERLALRNWRVVFDKLYCLLRWGHYHTLASQFMNGACLPSAPSSSGDQEQVTTLAPTQKASFSRRGSSKEVSPRSAAKVTGRELETTTASTAGTSKAKAKPSKKQAKTEGAMEPSADEFLLVIADQQEKLELAESQVELLTGNTLDFTLAEEAAASMEMAAPSMNDDLRREAVQVVREYQRLRAIEQETRFKSNHFPGRQRRRTTGPPCWDGGFAKELLDLADGAPGGDEIYFELGPAQAADAGAWCRPRNGYVGAFAIWAGTFVSFASDEASQAEVQTTRR
ncbi:Beta-hexosaminidase subunit beta, partial [Symbiodinium microadriaticum]